MLSLQRWGRGAKAEAPGFPIAALAADPPDWDYAGIDPGAFRDAILRSGAVMLRGAADIKTLAQIRAALEGLFDKFAATPLVEFEKHLASPNPDERDLWEQIKLSHIFERTFKPATGRSYFEVIRDSGLWNLAAQAFPEATVSESPVCNSRRVSDKDPRDVFDRPIDFHIDAQFFYDHQLSINFWTPLMSCGVDAPGLKVVRMGVDETRRYLEHDRRGYKRSPGDIAYMHKFKCRKMTAPPIEANNLLPRIWAPEFELGDVLAFSNFTMHGTHYTSAMSRPRVSVEVRVDLPGFLLRFPPPGGA